MTTATVAAPSHTVPMRRRFTVDEYFALAEAGILHEDERVELIDGEIIVMSPINDPHRQAVNWIGLLLSESLARRAKVQVQATIVLNDATAPEPDIAVICFRTINDLVTVTPEEIYLLVEVADGSQAFECDTKLPRYAAAGISEVWIANLVNRRVEVHADPVDGAYRSVRIIYAGATVSPQAFPDVTLAVSDFLPGQIRCCQRTASCAP